MSKQYKPNWLKEAIIYSLDVRSYKDGNGDGLGDLTGLMSKLEYLADLGVNCLWMVPFYYSGNRDGGYDVVDYYQVDPKFGTIDEFKTLVDKASAYNINVLIDLVVNHTSIEHPWFKQAINEHSPYHKYYLWMKEKPEKDRKDVVFKTKEDSNWEYSEEANSYYYHTFYKHQPDLNVSHPLVQKEILSVIHYWMKTGIAGFRIDAVPHMLKNKGNARFEDNSYEILEIWKQAMRQYRNDAVLIGEADVEPEDYLKFFGDGKKINGLFNFFLNNYLFLAMAEHCAKPLERAFQRLPFPSGSDQYLNFIRNHDELDLERLTEEERLRVFELFAPCEHMRIYNRGIRRRLPAMVNNHSARINLAMSFLLTLPGSPVIRYGEEIGMGDDLRLPERETVRTTMQWDTSSNGGFSNADSQKLQWPIIDSGTYGYPSVNVSSQYGIPSSILEQVKIMIKTRKSHLAFNYGKFKLVETGHPQVMAYLYLLDKQRLLITHNLSYQVAEAQISIDTEAIDKLIGEATIDLNAHLLKLTLPPYTYCWLSLL